MRAVLATNDPVLLSYVTALLSGEGIESTVLDQNISAVEASIGIFPKRVAVQNDVWSQAVRVLKDAGLGDQIISDDLA